MAFPRFSEKTHLRGRRHPIQRQEPRADVVALAGQAAEDSPDNFLEFSWGDNSVYCLYVCIYIYIHMHIYIYKYLYTYINIYEFEDI